MFNLCYFFFFFYQVFRKLDEGHQKQKEDLNRELLEVKASLKVELQATVE